MPSEPVLTRLLRRWLADRPRRMLQGGRATVPQFDGEEMLHMRHTLHPDYGYTDGNSVDDRMQRLVEQIRLQEQSVNRGKFSRPIDVLFPGYCQCGILSYSVAAVRCPPISVNGQKGVRYEWRWDVEHAPQEDNYAHSNTYAIRTTLRGDARLDEPKVKPESSTAKTAVRERIVQHPSFVETRPAKPDSKDGLCWIIKRRLGIG